MPITEFKIRKEVLVNTGNYENTKITHEMTYKVDDENEIEQARIHVTNRLDTYLNDQVRLIKSGRGR